MTKGASWFLVGLWLAAASGAPHEKAMPRPRLLADYAVNLVTAKRAAVRIWWDASETPDIHQYSVEWGLEQGIHPRRRAVRDKETAMLWLSRGTMYFVVCRAVDEFGIESDPSNEISITP